MKTDILLNAMGEIRDDIIADAKTQTKIKRFTTRIIGCMVAVLILGSMLTIPALAAADVDFAYDILYGIFPQIAQKLKPVRMSCEDNGIRMEVIAADIEGDTANIYISMQDLTGDRIDETTDLFDSYDINRAFDCSATCSLVDYSAEAKTATFLIQLTQMRGQPIGGEKLTFSVAQFLSHKNKVDRFLTEIDLSTDVDMNPETKTGEEIMENNMRWTDFDEYDYSNYLAPSTEVVCTPVPGILITSIGYIDGTLHVQTVSENNPETDNNCSIGLYTANDNALDGNVIHYWDEEHKNMYVEFFFDVPAEQLAECKLKGYFVTCDMLTKGDWQITFPIG